MLGAQARNIASRVRRCHQDERVEGAKAIYQSRTSREAADRFQSWATTWRILEPDAVACLHRDIDEMISFLACPPGHWRKIRTTNAIERAFSETRRRTGPMSCFQNSASVDRIIFGVISHFNNNWRPKPLLHLHTLLDHRFPAHFDRDWIWG